MPRRNRFHFKVRVPADFGDKELVWTLTTQGQTEKAYATLIPEYVIDKQLPMLDVGNFGRDPEGRDMLNEAPTVQLEGPAARRAAVGAPLHLTAAARDDGMPEPKPAPQGRPGSPRSRSNALGLRVAWYVYRGDGAHVTFDPPQFKAYPDYRLNSNSPWSPGWETPELPADGKWPVTATFSRPGEYVVRVLATDGGPDRPPRRGRDGALTGRIPALGTGRLLTADRAPVPLQFYRRVPAMSVLTRNSVLPAVM